MFDWFRKKAHHHHFGLGEQSEFVGIPCTGGGHTTFLVFICSCGAYQLFPQSNFALTTEEFRIIHFAEWLRRHNLTEEIS